MESRIAIDGDVQYSRSKRVFEQHIERSNVAMSLFDFPYELRQTILQYALLSKGTVELQAPVWAGLAAFANPLFHVCRALRQEAIEAFYKGNSFLWIIDTEQKLRSDPATYGETDSQDISQGTLVPSEPPSPLHSTLPWKYPNLMKHLRYLQVNIYLPQNNDAGALEKALDALIQSLDHGHRLRHIHVLITAKRRAQYLPLTTQEVKALETLTRMEIRGSVEVQTRYYFRAVAACVQGMNLRRRMKA